MWSLILFFYFDFTIKIFPLPQYKHVPVPLLFLPFLLQFPLIHFSSVHFTIRIVIRSKISRLKRTLFWWLPSSVSFSLYLMYLGLLPCNYKVIRANLPYHWSIPVLYRTINFLVCTLLSVSTSRTIIIINFIYIIFNIISLILIIFLSLSHGVSLNILFIGLSI